MHIQNFEYKYKVIRYKLRLEITLVAGFECTFLYCALSSIPPLQLNNPSQLFNPDMFLICIDILWLSEGNGEIE